MTIVITGHGVYASGIESMIKLVLGAQDCLKFVDFEEGKTPAMINEEFTKLYKESTSGIVFLTDIAGGTPFNQAVIAIHENGGNGAVVGGANIPFILALLELIEEDYTDIKSLCREAKIMAIDSMNIYGDTVTKKNEPNESDDGI